MDFTIKQIKKELKNAISIEEALLAMLIARTNYADSDLKLIVSKVFETNTYIVQLQDMLERAIVLKHKKGEKDE
tara:strand:+ start:130 stop:351 length:222 start_codon:yes stop_codon:yes gene_type:complete